MRPLPAPADRIESIIKTRKAAAESLVQVLATSISGRSEFALSSRWLSFLKLHSHLVPSGWYQPPPGGATILIASVDDHSRLDFESLRHPVCWPREDSRAAGNSLFYSYCSPVDRQTGMMGDIAVTLYRGEDRHLRDGLSRTIDLTSRIVDHAAVGMSFSDLFEFAVELAHATGLRNTSHSRTHPDSPNIGHTIPWLTGDYPEVTISWLQGRGTTDIGRVLSQSREFIRAGSARCIAETDGFTIEPRFAGGGLPSLSFHVIVLFHRGTKTVCAEFRELFEVFAMHDYLPRDALRALRCT